MKFQTVNNASTQHWLNMHAVLSQSEAWRHLEIPPRKVILKSVWLRAIRNEKAI